MAKEVLKEYVMKREFEVVMERNGDGFYIGSIPSLRGCHTQVKFLDELMARIKEVIKLCLEAGEEFKKIVKK
jgi:predicted RNase H-like HicB family nuclease